MIPLAPNKDSWKTGIRKGLREDKYYLQTVRILASKHFPLLEAVVFMDSSEEGELGRRKRAIKKDRILLISLSLEIVYYTILREKGTEVWKRQLEELGHSWDFSSTIILPTNPSRAFYC